MADRVCSCGPPIEKWFSILHRSYPAARSNKRGWNSSMPKRADQECGCGRHQRRSNFRPAPQESVGLIFNAAIRRSPARQADRWNSSGEQVGPLCGCGRHQRAAILPAAQEVRWKFIGSKSEAICLVR
jgi:hypothetical protein